MNHLKNLDPRRVSCSKVHTEDSQMLGATVQNLVATATWRTELMHLPIVYICMYILLNTVSM